jgi:hypothetical protein
LLLSTKRSNDPGCGPMIWPHVLADLGG